MNQNGRMERAVGATMAALASPRLSATGDGRHALDSQVVALVGLPTTRVEFARALAERLRRARAEDAAWPKLTVISLGEVRAELDRPSIFEVRAVAYERLDAALARGELVIWDGDNMGQTGRARLSNAAAKHPRARVVGVRIHVWPWAALARNHRRGRPVPWRLMLAAYRRLCGVDAEHLRRTCFAEAVDVRL